MLSLWIRRGITVVIVVAAVLVVYLYLQSLLAYLLISALITLLARPVYHRILGVRIKGWGPPPWLVALLTLVVFVIGLLGLLGLFLPPLISQFQELSQLDPAQIVEGLKGPLGKVQAFFDRYNMEIDVERALRDASKTWVSGLSSGNFISGLAGVATGVGSFFVGLFSVFFITFFFLKEEGLIRKIILAPIPSKNVATTTKALEKTKRLLRRYFTGLLLVVSIVGTLNFIGLSIVGVENALLIAIIGGVINIIPYLGPILATIIGLIVTTLTNLELSFFDELLPLLLKVLLSFMGVQLVDNYVLQPYIQGRSVRAHPLEIFVVILAGGSLAGVLGMVIAVPVFATLRVFAEAFFPDNKLVHAFGSMDDEPEREDEDEAEAETERQRHARYMPPEED